MNTENGQVYILEDDQMIADHLAAIFATVQLSVVKFGSSEEFLKQFRDEGYGVVLLDIRLPSMSGIDVLKILRGKQTSMPIIMVTGHADVRTAITCMKLGVFDIVEKPIHNQSMIDLVQKALRHHREIRAQAEEAKKIGGYRSLLSDRELEILGHLVSGKSTKVIAEVLGISAHTVDNHRAKILQKMAAESVVDLVRMEMQWRHFHMPQMAQLQQLSVG